MLEYLLALMILVGAFFIFLGQWMQIETSPLNYHLMIPSTKTNNLKHPSVAASLRDCTYEGNCQVLATCGVSGKCRPYLQVSEIPELLTQTTTQTKHSKCVEQCINDATWDERYYFISVANVMGTMEYTSQDGDTPNGCIISYRRSPSSKPQPTPEEWRKHRVGALVRRDPIPGYRGKDVQPWSVLCYNPCQVDSDCGTGMRDDVASFHCVKGHCKRTNKNAQSNNIFGRDDITNYKEGVTNGKYSDLWVVSYANTGYFRGLKELAASLRYWAPHVRMAVYNLGMNPEQIAEVERWSNVKEFLWRDGFPDGTPTHFKQLKVYAWKPFLIADAAKRLKKILALDGGSVVRGPLDPVERILEETGNYLVWGQDADMMYKAHEGMFKWFNYTKETFEGGPHYGGNTQGYMYPSHWYDNIVTPMLACTMDQSCIAPPGSSSANNRYDQTALAIVSYQFHNMPQPHTEYIAESSRQVNSDFQQPSQKCIWTARQSSNKYFDAGY